jgi:hypothetical protein
VTRRSGISVSRGRKSVEDRQFAFIAQPGFTPFGRNRRMAHTKARRSPRRAPQKRTSFWNRTACASEVERNGLSICTATSPNPVFLRKSWQGRHGSHANPRNYVSRRDAGTQGRKDGCGSLISAPPRLRARRFWLRPKAALGDWRDSSLQRTFVAWWLRVRTRYGSYEDS